MATAELNVVVNLISKVGKGITPLKKDVTEVATALENMLSSPLTREGQGKGFLALFDIKESDSPKKVIDNIALAIKELQLSLQTGEGIDLLKAFGLDDATAVSNALDDLGASAAAVFSEQARAKFQEKAKRFFDLPLDQFEQETAEFKALVKQLDEAAILLPIEGKKGTATEQYAQQIRRHREALEAMAASGKEATGAALKEAQARVTGEDKIEKAGVAKKKQRADEAVALAKKTASAIIEEYYLSAEQQVKVEKAVQDEIAKAREQGAAQWKKNLAQIQSILTQVQESIKQKLKAGLPADADRAQAAQLEALAAAYKIFIDNNVTATKAGAVKETQIRQEAGDQAVKIAESTAEKQIAAEKTVTNARVAEIQKQIREYQQLIASAQQKIEALPKGSASSKRDLKEDITSYKAAIKELTKELETFGVKQVDIAKDSAEQRATAVKQGVDQEIDAQKAGANEAVKVEENKNDALQALADKWAARKKTVADSSDVVREAGEAELRALEQQKEREAELIRVAEQQERREVEQTTDAVIASTRKVVDAQQEASKARTSSKDTRVFDEAKIAEAIVDIERRLAAEIEQIQINLARKIETVQSSRVDSSKETSAMVARQEEAAADAVTAAWLEAANKFKTILAGRDVQIDVKFTGSGSATLPISEKIASIRKMIDELIAGANQKKLDIKAARTTEELKKVTSEVAVLTSGLKKAEVEANKLVNELATKGKTDLGLNNRQIIDFQTQLYESIDVAKKAQADTVEVFEQGARQINDIARQSQEEQTKTAQQGADARGEIQKKELIQTEQTERAKQEMQIRLATKTVDELTEIARKLQERISVEGAFSKLSGGQGMTQTSRLLQAQLEAVEEALARKRAIEEDAAKQSIALAEEEAAQRVRLEEEAQSKLIAIQLEGHARSKAEASGYAQANAKIAEAEQAAVVAAMEKAFATIIALRKKMAASQEGGAVLSPEALKQSQTALEAWGGALQRIVERKHQLIIEGKWKASPIVGLTEGLDNLRKRLEGLPKKSDFVIAFQNAEDLVSLVNTMREGAIKAYDEVAAARKRLSEATTQAASDEAMLEVMQAERVAAERARAYDETVVAARNAYEAAQALANSYAQEDIAQAAKIEQEKNRERVRLAIEGGDQILAANQAAVRRTLAAQEDAYVQLLRAREAYNASMARLAETDIGTAERELAEQSVASMQTMLEAASRAYKTRSNEHKTALAEMAKAEENFLQTTVATDDQILAADQQKNDQMEAAYRQHAKDMVQIASDGAAGMDAIARKQAEDAAAIQASTSKGFAEIEKQKTKTATEEAELRVAANAKTNDELEAQENEYLRTSEAAYREHNKTKKGLAEDGAAGMEALARAQAAEEKKIQESTAAGFAEIERQKTKTQKDELENREAAARKTADEILEYEKEIARQTLADAKKSAKEKVDAIKSSLGDARKASAAVGQVIQDALASGSKQGAKDAVAAYNQIKKEIALIGTASQKAGKAMRDGLADEAAAAAKDVAAAIERIKVQLSGVGIAWDEAVGGSFTTGLNSAKMWEDRMNSLSYRFTHVGFQLGIFGAAAMEAFKTPVEAAAELAKTIEYTAAIAGGGAEKVDMLRKAALELGSTTIYSSTKAAEGMRALVQAGLSAEQAIGAVKPVLDFASSGMLDLDAAGRIAISTMNQFGLNLSQLPEITNNIQAAANKTNAEVKDFGEALKNVGPTAKSVGASLQDTTAALGVLSQAGINASTAGTQLRGIYRRLLEASNESSKAGKIFKELGMSVIDSAGNFKDFAVILEEFRDRTADMSEVERAAKIYEIFGQRAGGPAMVALLNAGSGAIEKLKGTISDAADQADVARERGEGLWGSIEKLKNAWQALTQTIGGAGAGPLKFLVDMLASLVNTLRQAVELSPEVKVLVSTFMAMAAVAGAISLTGAAFALLMGNITSVLGVMGPLKRMFDTLMLTMRGVDAATAAQIIKERELAAAKAVTLTETEAQLVANGKLTVSNGVLTASNASLTASFKALSTAQKAVMVIMVALAAIEVGRLLWEMAGALKDASDWADRAAKNMDKFRDAIEKPIATKQEFALMTEEQMRAEIQRASKAKQFWIASIDDIERKIATRKAWSFGLWNTSSLEAELRKQQKELQNVLDTEAYLKIKPKVDMTEAAQTAKRQATAVVTEIDLIFGNKKLGIDKFDLSKVLEGVDKTKSALAKIEQAAAQAGDAIESNLNTSVTESVTHVDKLKQAYEDLGIEISQATARELQDTREVNEEKLRIVEDYYSAAMQAVEGFNEAGSDEEKKLAEQRQNAYEETLESLDQMYEDALKKMEQYAQDVLDAEKNLAKERVDAYNWYIEQTEVSDKLKSQRQKLRENEEARAKLFKLYDEQVAAGDLKRAEETLGQIQKLVEEANKAQNEDLADAVMNREKALKQIAELEAKMGAQQETRLDRASEKSKRYSQQQIDALEKVTAAEEKLRALQDKQRAATTEKERLRLAEQIKEQEKRVTDLKEKAAGYDEKSAAARAKGADLSSTEESEERKLETLRAQLTTYDNIIEAAGAQGRAAQETYRLKLEEEKTGRGILETQQATERLAADTKRTYESRIAIHEQLLSKAKAELAVWAEQANNAKLTKAVVVSIHESLGKLSLAEGASDELKRLQEKLKGEKIGVSFTAETADSRTLQIMDLATGKVMKELVIPIRAGGEANLVKDTLDGLKEIRAEGGVSLVKTDATTMKAVEALGKVGTQIGGQAGADAGTEFGKKFGSTLSPEAAKAMQDFANKWRQSSGPVATAATEAAKSVATVGDAAKAAGKEQERAAESAAQTQVQATKEVAVANEAAAERVEISWKLAFSNMARASNVEKWEGITPFEEFWRRRFNNVVDAWNWAVGGMSTAAGALQSAWQTVANAIAAGWEATMQKLESAALAAVNTIKSGWRSWSNFIIGLGEKVASFFTGIWDGVYNAAKKLWDAFALFWGTTVWDLLNKIEDWAKNTSLYQMWEDIKTLASDFWSWVVSVINEVAALIQSTFIDPFVKAWDTVSSAARAFWDGLQNMIQQAQNWVESNLFKPFKDGWNSLTSPMTNFFSKLEGWINKAKDWWDDLIAKAKALLGMSPTGGSFGGAGASGDTDTPPEPQGRWGGLVNFARGMAQGGHLPGYGGGDRRLTLLEDGEYVLPKEAVRGIGVDTLNGLRAMFLRGMGLPKFTVGIPKMAAGGAVSASTQTSMGVYDVNLHVGGSTFSLMSRREVAEALIETMRREGMTKR